LRAILRASGQVCLTIGVVITLFIGYLFWGSGVRADQAQRQFAALWFWLFPRVYTTFPV
jgi:hypothetical protein